MGSPTVPPPEPHGLNRVLDRNIEELRRRRENEKRAAGLQQRIAAAVTGFVGTMTFAYLHIVIVGFWTAINLGLVPGAPRFDRSFVGLATVASVEGIFLTTFVLISQNRDAKLADRRAELDLQINLLAEHEITKLIALVREMAVRQGIEVDRGEIGELERDVAPETVADELEKREERGQ